VFLSALSILVLGLLTAVVDTSRWTSRQTDEVSVQASAESAMTLAVSRLWGDFLRQTEGQKVHIWDFQAYLDDLGVANQEDIQKSKTQETGTDLVSQLGLAVNTHGDQALSGVVIESISVERQDDFDNTLLDIEVRVSSDRGAKSDDSALVVTDTVRATWMVEAADWEGLEYAMLANNVNCILCHTDVDNAQRIYNSDPAQYGTFDRVKLGSLETFQIRESPHSTLAGTLYLGGDALTESGQRVSAWSGITLKSREFDDEGKLVEDAWGETQPTHLSPADLIDPDPLENLYLDYLNPDIEQVDGYLTETFPSPFPDDGGYDFVKNESIPENAGNRIVDDSEFAAATRGAAGTISGGIISTIPHGDTITNHMQLHALTAGNSKSISGTVSGNVYLHGTKDNPILLNGPLGVDGDLFISGYVKGKGTLNVRNNVYVLDSVKYADATPGGHRTFGSAADGAENGLAIASGGNVSVGDIFRPAFGTGGPTTGDKNGSYSFIMEEMGTFNRMEWMKTQPTLLGKWAKVKTGTKYYKKKVQPKKKIKVAKLVKQYKKVADGQKKVPVYKWVKVSNGLPAPYTEWKNVKQLVGYKWVTIYKKVFVGYTTKYVWKWVNDGPPYYVQKKKDIYQWQKPQLANPYFEGEDYVPRYYSFNEDGKVPIYNKDGYFDPATKSWRAKSVLAGGWDTKKLTIADPTNLGDPILYGHGGKPKAVVSYITSTDTWMSDQMLKLLLREALAARDKGPIEIDATVYSNNSIFGVIPDHKEPTLDGTLVVNGGLVAADIGLLAPNGTQLNFDERGKELLDLNDDSRLQITRLLWAPSH